MSVWLGKAHRQARLCFDLWAVLLRGANQHPTHTSWASPPAKAKGKKGQKAGPWGPLQVVTQAVKRATFGFWCGDRAQAFHMLSCIPAPQQRHKKAILCDVVRQGLGMEWGGHFLHALALWWKL